MAQGPVRVVMLLDILSQDCFEVTAADDGASSRGTAVRVPQVEVRCRYSNLTEVLAGLRALQS